jgi:Protein of unknown function (DUF3574)
MLAPIPAVPHAIADPLGPGPREKTPAVRAWEKGTPSSWPPHRAHGDHAGGWVVRTLRTFVAPTDTIRGERDHGGRDKIRKEYFAMKTYRVLVLAFALLLAPSGVAAAEALPCAVVDGQSIADRQSIDRQTAQRHFIGERFVRTELFFGLAKSDGEVTETEFRRFLHECVAPRFPDGFTVVAGFGHFRDDDRIPIEERSKVLILLYPDDARQESGKRIEEIREAYKEIFQQESVLRADHCCEQAEF